MEIIAEHLNQYKETLSTTNNGHVKLLAGQTPCQPATSSTSTECSSSDPRALAGAQALAGLLLKEISMRWPGQAGKWQRDAGMAASWARGLLDAGVTDPRSLVKALARCTARPYPPDLGALLAEAATGGIEGIYAEASFVRAARAAGALPPAFYTLTPAEYFAGSQFGWQELRESPTTERNVKRWRALLADAAGRSDLPAVPAKPAGELPAPPSQKRDIRALWASIQHN